ncbi:MAG: glycosyltransferase family 2 protein, partial [Bdellovibrionales bacterium]|nr:glycosyltransferase family 2 protein [Bdellovibrionales bacterium]
MVTINSGPLVSGIFFIKHGISLDYPVVESIKSIEPLCDEIIINVGFSDRNLKEDDGTYDLLRGIFTHKKFIFLKSFWDPQIASRGTILSQQTNISLAKAHGKICQYIQGDEVIHEDDLSEIHNGIIHMERNPQIEGLIFKYLHFYGSPDYIRQTRSVYRREVRTIRNNIGVRSYLDAQGFRHSDNSKLFCREINARIFHYGWARKEQLMHKKIEAMNRLYHGEDCTSKDNFEYQRLWGVKPFQQTHP